MKYLLALFLFWSPASIAAGSGADTTAVRDLARKIKEKRYWASYPDSMLFYARTGMELAKAIQDDYGMADMNKFYGIYYWTTGDHASSIDHYVTARTIYEKLGKRFEAAQILANLGMVYMRLGDNEKALNYYQQAIAVMESMPHPDISSLAATVSSMGLLFRNHDDLSSARSMFTRALNLYEEAKDSLNIAGTLTNLGTVYSRSQSFDSAIIYHERAEKIFARLNNQRGLVIAYNNLASAAEEAKKHDQALAYLNKAYAINNERGFFDSQIATLIGLGNVYVGLKEYAKAEAYFREGFEIARKKNPSRLIDIYQGLSTATEGSGNLSQALDYHRRYVALKDSIYSQENAALISNLRISNELDRKNTAITLLEKDNKIEKLYRNTVIIASLAILLALSVLSYALFQKMRKDKKLMRQQEELHAAKQAVSQAELNSRKEREEELHRELEFRNRALTTYTLNLVQKNGMLDEVRGIAQMVLKEPDQKEAELKKLIRLIDYSFSLDKDWDGFKTYFEQVHPDFFKKLKATYPELSATELKLCALIRLSLSIKESASVLSISPDSVKVSRHRVRKKLGLTTDDNLTQFIMAV